LAELELEPDCFPHAVARRATTRNALAKKNFVSMILRTARLSRAHLLLIRIGVWRKALDIDRLERPTLFQNRSQSL
jgi:hypothetical protein